MFIQAHTCISPQQSIGNTHLRQAAEAMDNKLMAIEPAYEGIPPGILRRMGKAVRMGVGAALPILNQYPGIKGIVMGTANGGMEDCIKFLNQIIDYAEGMLTPGNFVQSTPNAIAAQMGLMTQNRWYNITHVHRGLAFENALQDVWMLLKEYPDREYLAGAVDEISAYNYNIDFLDGWYKKEAVTAAGLYESVTPGSLAGEGAAMFLMSNNQEGAVAELKGIRTIHTHDELLVETTLANLLSQHLPTDEKIGLLITGENGDNRLMGFYKRIERFFETGTTVARYKHLSGEFPTSTGFALWMACCPTQLPGHCIKTGTISSGESNILIYNNYKGLQHSFILLKKLI